MPVSRALADRCDAAVMLLAMAQALPVRRLAPELHAAFRVEPLPADFRNLSALLDWAKP